MNEMPRFSWWTLLALLLVLGGAAWARSWYVATCTDNGEHEPALIVQGPWPRSLLTEEKPIRRRMPATQLESLVKSVTDQHSFQCRAPFADKEEPTAHVAPGYPMLASALVYWDRDSADTKMRWLQCVLGTLTAGCYFFFARRAFHNTLIATLAGLLCAFHPFWIVNTAELNDGVLVSFLVGASLALGARAGQVGGAFTALIFGLTLAGVALTDRKSVV